VLKLELEPETTPNPIQLELYRRASPEQKLRVVARLNSALIALKAAQLDSDYAHLPPEARHAMLRRWWLTARD
jgi:hypothetical protein